MMLEMKIDMAGAAVVLGTMSTLRDLGCPARVVGWLPLTDNMGGGDATRIGDVLRARNGTTIEVHNADAEGRLILADGLALACESRPDALVDIATLTAAVSMAVGRRHAGLMGNHDGWLGQVRDAAARAGEAVWPLPMPDDLRPELDSKVADLVNVAGHQYGQTVLGALFLREFVAGGIPWAHLDIAGPAFSEKDDGEWAAGATGFGVRTLVELLGAYRRP
jgi:leucyl aminopeptidase